MLFFIKRSCIKSEPIGDTIIIFAVVIIGQLHVIIQSFGTMSFIQAHSVCMCTTVAYMPRCIYV